MGLQKSSAKMLVGILENMIYTPKMGYTISARVHNVNSSCYYKNFTILEQVYVVRGTFVYHKAGSIRFVLSLEGVIKYSPVV